ncbi:MAG: hypothetical protein NC115_10090 [Bacteroidales bacterium]|nr:hypothetical protein [Bacteroides sp.]MCM1502999.1 hypothetical protein [Bacteroidales bacterium]
MKKQFIGMAVMMAIMQMASCSTLTASRPEAPVSGATVDVYGYAPSVIPSVFWSVKVEGTEAFVLPTLEHDVCIFGCDKPVNVSVNYQGGVCRIC